MARKTVAGSAWLVGTLTVAVLFASWHARQAQRSPSAAWSASPSEATVSPHPSIDSQYIPTGPRPPQAFWDTLNMQGVYLGVSADAAYKHCLKLDPQVINHKWEVSPAGYRSIGLSKKPTLGVYTLKATVVAVNGWELDAGATAIAREGEPPQSLNVLGRPDDAKPEFLAWKLTPTRLLVVGMKGDGMVDNMYLGDTALFGSGDFHDWGLPNFLVSPKRPR